MPLLNANKKKSNKKYQDNLNDLLGDLLEPDETPKKKPVQGKTQTTLKNGTKDDDFYSSLAAMAENGGDSDVSEADVNTLAKSIADLDDMDADLFGDNLKKRGSFKSSGHPGSKQNTPRQGGSTPRSQSTPPHSAAKKGSPRRVASPTQTVSPPNSAGGLGLKKKPVKPSPTAQSPPPPPLVQAGHKPGTAPGKMTDIRGAGGILKPGQPKEEQRPSTTPKAKQKYDFGDFDEDDPLAGLSLDEDSVSEAARKPLANTSAGSKTAIDQQISQDEQKSPQHISQPQSPRKPSLLERPPTRSGGGDSKSMDDPQAKSAPPVTKHREDMVFSDDDQFLDGLGLEGGDIKGTSLPSTAKSRLSQSADDESRPARSVLDSLLGRREDSSASHLETKERPKQFVLDKKYTQSKEGEGKQEEEDGFLFGNYQPSAASGSRPSSRRSVRFQDDDDIFGKDPPASTQRQLSGSRVPDDMGWLEELTRDEKAAQPSKASQSAVPVSLASSSIPMSAAAKSSQGQSLPDKAAPTATVSGLLKPEEPESQVATRTSDSHPKQSHEAASPEQPADKESKKPNPKDWLGLGSSDSDEEYFKPKRIPSRSSGIVQTQPKAPSPMVGSQQKPHLLEISQNLRDADDEEDSLLERVRARRQQAMANQATGTPKVSLLGAADSQTLIKSPGQASATKTHSSGFVPDAGESFGEVSGRRSSLLVSRHDTDSMAGTSANGLIYSPPPATEGIRGNNLSFQHQLQQQQQLLQFQKQQSQLPLPDQTMPQNVSTDVPGHSSPSLSSLQLHVQSLSTSLHNTVTSTIHGSQPASLEEAVTRIRKLEIEKQYLDSALESSRRRYEEEVLAIEKSYKNRIQILEEANQKTETRLRGELEQLMEQHLTRIKKMEQEKADLAAENYRRLEEQERSSAQDIEKLKEKHRQVLASLKQEHEEIMKLLAEAKNKEIEKVATANDTSRSLSVVMEQIQSNARDLGHLQMKVDSWSRAGMDEREIALRARDEQLRILQERLSKQEQDNEKERHRLEDLIARMEVQNREQLRQLEEERWKVKQEQSRLDAQLAVLDSERQTWSEQQARERQSLEKAREIFLEEQRSGLSHLTDERRSLAEERSKLNMEQKLYREKIQHDAIRNAQAEAEYHVLMKTIEDEKKRAAERMRDLQKEADRVFAEREAVHESIAALDHEKQQLEQLAVSLKQRSAELEAMSEEANHRHVEGEKAVAEARKLQTKYSQQNNELEVQLSSIKAAEDHIAQEKLRLAKEKKELGSLKQAGLCAACRSSLNASSSQMASCSGNFIVGNTASNNILAGLVPSPVNAHPHYLPSLASSALGVTPPVFQTIASSIANDRAVRMWKIQAIKDQEYLEEESLFLEGLQHSPYHTVYKA